MLQALARARLEDAVVLLRAAELQKAPQRRVGAIYLAGYAVECALKARICFEKSLPALPRDLWEHNLRFLSERTRRGRQMLQEQGIMASFRHVESVWTTALRYRLPSIPAQEAWRFWERAQEVTRWLFSE